MHPTQTLWAGRPGHPTPATVHPSCTGTQTRKQKVTTRMQHSQSHVVPLKTAPQLPSSHVAMTPANRRPLFSLSVTLAPEVPSPPTSCRGRGPGGLPPPGEVLWEGHTDPTRTEAKGALTGRQEQLTPPPLPGWAHTAGRTGPRRHRWGPSPSHRPDSSTDGISPRPPHLDSAPACALQA